jgi:hypothetical protein
MKIIAKIFDNAVFILWTVAMIQLGWHAYPKLNPLLETITQVSTVDEKIKEFLK